MSDDLLPIVAEREARRLDILKLALEYFHGPQDWGVVQAIAAEMIALVENGVPFSVAERAPKSPIEPVQDRSIADIEQTPAADGKRSEIVTAAQEPLAAPLRRSEADGRGSDVDASPAQAISEKVTAGGRTANPRPSSQGGRIASAGASLVPRTSPITADLRPTAKAPPLKVGPLLSVRSSPDVKRVGEEAQIAQFLAKNGARKVMSAEQVAAFLRDAGHKATVRIAAPANRTAKKSTTHYLDRAELWLDGKKVGERAFYAAVNELRHAVGRPPVEPALRDGGTV